MIQLQKILLLVNAQEVSQELQSIHLVSWHLAVMMII